VEWVPEEDVQKAKLASKNYDPNDPKGVWVTWEDEMRRKVAIKRAQKYWPKSDGRAAERLAEAIRMDNAVVGGEAAEREPVDVTPRKQEKISADQVKELLDAATEARLNIDKVCEVYFIDKIQDLPAKLIDEVKARIKKAGELTAEKRKQHGAEKK
jgi:recombinational DNA repair protein RecT